MAKTHLETEKFMVSANSTMTHHIKSAMPFIWAQEVQHRLPTVSASQPLALSDIDSA